MPDLSLKRVDAAIHAVTSWATGWTDRDRAIFLAGMKAAERVAGQAETEDGYVITGVGRDAIRTAIRGLKKEM